MNKSGQAFPPFACKVLEYIDCSIHHPHQLSLAQFSAYHLREIIYNLDMIAIACTTKLTATSKENVEDETPEHSNSFGPAVETEFHGGEQVEEPENDDMHADAWHPRVPLQHVQLTAILARHSEITAPGKKGRKSAAVIQMKAFDECYHTVLNTSVPASDAKSQKA